jgi:predicted secreted Zn-dependent protease
MLIVAVLAFQVATYTLPDVDLPPYVSEEPTIVWYPITGATIRDLQSQMRALGPRDAEGSHAGYTRGYTYWHETVASHDGTCWISTVRVTAYDTVTLPLWSPPPNADSAVVAEWSRFVTMLGRHEAGHRAISLDAAGQIARTIATLPSRASCADLITDANAHGHAILASADGRQKQYDAETNHGARRGTLLEDLGPGPRRVPLALIVLVGAVVALILVRLFRGVFH